MSKSADCLPFFDANQKIQSVSTLLRPIKLCSVYLKSEETSGRGSLNECHTHFFLIFRKLNLQKKNAFSRKSIVTSTCSKIESRAATDLIHIPN